MSDDDENENDEDAGPANIRGLHGGPDNAAPPPCQGWTGPPAESVYADMWAAFREGSQGTRKLARRCRVAFRTAATAIERGWPERGWPALRDRLELWERQREQARTREIAAERAAAEAQGVSEAQAWSSFQGRAQTLLRQAEAVLGAMGKKLQSAVELATFVRYRRVRTLGPDGVMHTTDQAYVSGLELAKATHLWTSSIKDMPPVMRLLLGPAALEPMPELPAFTEAQLAEMADGRLPAGVNEQQVAMALIAAAKQSVGGDP